MTIEPQINLASNRTKSKAKGATVKPPSEERMSGPRIISGLDLIDFGAGGLYPDKTYLIQGSAGTGKSIIGIQFLARGLELGDTGVLITNRKPEDLLTQAATLGFPLDDAVSRGQLKILNPSNRYFELVESPADVMAIMDELGDYIRESGAKRLVVDTIHSLINTTYSGHFTMTITQSIANAFEELPVTTLLIGGDEQDAEQIPVLRTLQDMVFGVVELSEDPSTGGRKMRLKKLRYASTDGMSAHYRILNGRGLINYQGDGEMVKDITQPWDAESRRTVLVIGSGPDTIKRIKEALGSEYQVSAEPDYTAGVERAKQERPGLVLLTPSRSLSAMQAVVELSRGSDSSVAFLSPRANRSTDKVLYLRAGADDFITEPFSGAELRARTEALIRRSGSRRLKVRDASIPELTSDEISALGRENEQSERQKKVVLSMDGDQIKVDEEFSDRLRRNIDTMAKLDTPFALYWLKSDEKDARLNKSMARLCRQEDVLCHNARGEFVSILTAADQEGVRGFEARVENLLDGRNVKKGYALYEPGKPLDGLIDEAFGLATQPG